MQARVVAAALAVALTACPGDFFFGDAGQACPAAGCPLGLECSAALGRCVECTASSHCGAANPVCNVASGRCVECRASSDCDAGSVCETAETSRCVPTCALDAGCELGRCRQLALGPVCDACVNEDVCEHMSVTRRCDPARRTCVRCFEDDHCAAPLRHCDRSTGTCRECIDTRDCVAGAFCLEGACRTN